MDVTVLGTSFEVFSYDGDEEGETVLLTGKVKGKYLKVIKEIWKLCFETERKVDI